MLIKAQKKPKHIYVLGKKDPRGPDNTITIWISDDGNLNIKVDKPSLRCYPFLRVKQTADSITVIQSK